MIRKLLESVCTNPVDMCTIELVQIYAEAVKEQEMWRESSWDTSNVRALFKKAKKLDVQLRTMPRKVVRAYHKGSAGFAPNLLVGHEDHKQGPGQKQHALSEDASRPRP